MALAQEQGQNKIIVDPSYLQRHVSERKLTFTVPKDWQVDEEATAKMGLYAVILPKGVKIEYADKVILMGFQYKDPKTPGMDTLANYQKANFDRARAQFPELQANKWRPSGLDPAKIDYLSAEHVSKSGEPAPSRQLMIDAGDGFYNVQLTAQDVGELRKAAYDEFFNSLKLLPALELPAAPEGFSWRKLKEINGAVLMPNGWHFKQEGGRPTLAYFVSLENIDKAGRYETGFTIQAMRPPQPRTGEEVAKAMIAGAESKKQLVRSWKRTKGVFDSYGLELKNLESNNEVTISHVLIITNTRTRTFYFCLFESVETKWKEAWKIGEQIVQTLILNDDI